MDDGWKERDLAFKSFYGKITLCYAGSLTPFKATPGIAGYIDDMIVTPMHLRRMDEAYLEHLKSREPDLKGGG